MRNIIPFNQTTIIIQVMFMLLVLQSSQCKCNGNKESLQKSKNNLIMEIPAEPVIGDQKIANINFKLDDKKIPLTLEDYILETTLSEEDKANGNNIQYTKSGNDTITNHAFTEPLHDLSGLNELNEENHNFPLPIHFKPKENAKEMQAHLKLLKKDGQIIQEGTINWKANNAPTISFSLKNLGGQIIKGDEAIQLAVENNGYQDAINNDLSIKIIRNEKTGTATIKGSHQLEEENLYEIFLFPLKSKEKTNYTFQVEQHQDKYANFSFQLHYKGEAIGNTIDIKWEKGASVEIKEVRHNKETNKLEAIIENNGTEHVENIIFNAQVKTPEAKIGGSNQQEKILPALAPGAKHVIEDLASLDFGKTTEGKDNETAHCKFDLICTKTDQKVITKGLEKAFPRLHVVPQITINYEPNTSKVNISVKNIGEDVGKNLTLVVKNNTAQGSEGVKATIAGKINTTISLGDLAKGQEVMHTMLIDLKDAPFADFSFEINYENGIIASYQERFKASPLAISLEIINPKSKQNKNLIKDNGLTQVFYGGNTNFMLKINNEATGRNIDKKDLELVVTSLSSNGSYLTDKSQNKAIATLTGNALPNLNESVELWIKPSPNSMEAIFQLQLFYKDKKIGLPFILRWQEYQAFIKQSGKLIGDNDGDFLICFSSTVNPDELTLQLKSDQGTVFQFYKVNGDLAPISQDIPLNELAELKPSYVTTPIKFKVKEENKQSSATVTLTIKRGEKILQEKNIDWSNKGSSLSINSERWFIMDDTKGVINIKNTNQKEIELSQFYIECDLSDSKHVLQLGNTTEMKGRHSLAVITGQKKLLSNATIKINIEMLTPLENEIATNVTIRVLNNQQILLDTEKIIFLTSHLGQLKNKIASIWQEGIVKVLEKPEIMQNQNISSLTKSLSLMHKELELNKKSIEKLAEIEKIDFDFHALANYYKNNYIIPTIITDENIIPLIDKILVTKYKESKEVSEWIKNMEENFSNLKKNIHKCMEDIQKSEQIYEITELLLNDIKAQKKDKPGNLTFLYHSYKANLGEIKIFLEDNPLNQNMTTEMKQHIQDLQTLYDTVYHEWQNLKPLMENCFVDGFTRYSLLLLKEEQKNAHLNKKQFNKEERYNMLMARKKTLENWQQASKNNKIFLIDTNELNTLLVQNYETLANQTLALAKIEYKKTNTGYLNNTDLLMQKIAKNAFDIAQISPNEITKQSAINIIKAAIQGFKLFERSRGYRHLNIKKSLIIAENYEFDSLPSILQTLTSYKENMSLATV